MENKDFFKPLERKTKAAYELGADVTIKFDNGDIIRINKSVLAFHTEFLVDVFFGPSPATNFTVENFDSETFRTFLDCLFGLKNYTVLDCLLIYPIAHHYQVKESLEKCVDVLEPKVVDANVSLILNLALFYKDDKLVKNVIDFIKTENGIVDFIENEDYRDLLEPISMWKLIEEIQLDSFVWKLVYKWGVTYLEKQCKPLDICSFFKEIGIFSKIEMDHFESVQSIFDFHEMSGMQLFDPNKILWYLKSSILDLEVKIPDKSEWVKVAEETLTETIEFSHPFGFLPEEQIKGLSFKISTNKIFFENYKENDEPVLKVKAKNSFRSIFINVEDSHHTSHRNFCGNRVRGHHCDCLVPLKTSSYKHSAVKETNLAVFPDELVLMINVVAPENRFLEIKSIEIAYNFIHFNKFRILKTTLNGNFNKADELYFTKNVIISPN